MSETVVKVSVSQILAEILCQDNDNLENRESYNSWTKDFNKLSTSDRKLMIKSVETYLISIVGKDLVEI